MGAYLDKPITEKNPTNGKSDLVSWGACSMQGWRCSQEDAHVTQQITLPDGSHGMLFCCFDGHGGKEVSQFSETNFPKIFQATQEFQDKNYGQALKSAFFKCDEKVSKEDYAQDTGTTACVVFITKTHIYCANAGDSRAVLAQKNRVVELSHDHKPDNQEEQARIEKAGHHVEDSRVDGNLALSRAFGDFQYKDGATLKPENQAVTCLPDLKEVKREPNNDKFIILACDGIWDCLSNEEACQAMQEQIDKASGPSADSDAVGEILNKILAPNTDDGIGTDNMTCILIRFL